MSDAEQSAHTQDVEPKAEEANAPINIKVRTLVYLLAQAADIWLDCVAIQVTTQTGEEVFFKIKRNTKLSKLQGAYAAKVGKDVNSIRYVVLPLRCRVWRPCNRRISVAQGSDSPPNSLHTASTRSSFH